MWRNDPEQGFIDPTNALGRTKRRNYFDILETFRAKPKYVCGVRMRQLTCAHAQSKHELKEFSFMVQHKEKNYGLKLRVFQNGHSVDYSSCFNLVFKGQIAL